MSVFQFQQQLSFILIKVAQRTGGFRLNSCMSRVFASMAKHWVLIYVLNGDK